LQADAREHNGRRHRADQYRVLANALFYYRCTDYDDQVKAVLNEASAWVAARAPGVDKPAIVLDIDETSLSNWEQIYHNKFGYVPSGACDLKAQSACGQRDWELSAQATAIGPTLDLFNAAQKLKGKNGEPVDIFFVTGRYEDPFERLATEWNLHKVGYDNWRGLFMRPDSSRNDKFVSRYKTLSRIKIEANHTIIANVGDQLSDLVGDQNGDHAERCFKVPNPLYFIPGRSGAERRPQMHGALEHDPEKAFPGLDPRGNRCSEKIMFSQKIRASIDSI
jgi:hypothetical protein